jgi:RNA polymerase sigma-70 factor (ECF subfamily)
VAQDLVLDAMMRAGSAAYPDVAPDEALRGFVAARLGAVADADDERGRDLYLAGAVARGDEAALRHLVAVLPGIVRPALARLGLAPGDDDEILQRVQVALVTPSASGAPGIAGYSGRGELRSYVRATAVRIALKRMEREDGPPLDDDSAVLALLPEDGDSPELRVLKDRCRADVKTAFAAAIATLAPRERTLLRQHYVDGLGIDQLAPLHGVHRATCARWIEAARLAVLRGVRGYLRDTLGLGATELDSMIDLVRSQLELSLARQLRG